MEFKVNFIVDKKYTEDKPPIPPEEPESRDLKPGGPSNQVLPKVTKKIKMPPVKPPKADVDHYTYGHTGGEGQIGTYGVKGTQGQESYSVFKTQECQFGTQLVDDIRGFLKDPDFPIKSIIDNTSCKFQTFLLLDLTEVQARISGHFSGCQVINVEVPPLFLTGYQDIKYSVTKGYNFKKAMFKKTVRFVHVNNKILYEDIINAWIKVGCPLKWNDDTDGFEE